MVMVRLDARTSGRRPATAVNHQLLGPDLDRHTAGAKTIGDRAQPIAP